MNAVDEKTAKDLVGRAIANEKEELTMERYFPKFTEAIGAARAAKFYQINRQINLLLRLRLASEIPLAGPR